MKTKVHFSSKDSERETPQDLFNKLNNEFHFTLDVCATKENAKCKQFFTKEQDGLKQNWFHQVIWMNPPYGNEIKKWVSHAYNTAMVGNHPIVCLLPARTDTIWWHDYVMKADEIRFIRGRLKFSNAQNSAPFPSCIVVFRSVINSRRGINCPICMTY